MPDFVPAQLLPGLQSYRGDLLQGQADPTQGLCQDTRGPAGGAGRSIIRGQLLGCPGILRARRLPSCGSITMKYAVRGFIGEHDRRVTDHDLRVPDAPVRVRPAKNLRRPERLLVELDGV